MHSRSAQKKIHISVLLQTNRKTKTKTKTGRRRMPSTSTSRSTRKGGKSSWKEQHFYDNVERGRAPTPYPCQKPITDNAQKDFYFSRFQFSFSYFFGFCWNFFFVCSLFVKLSERETGASASRRRGRSSEPG